MNQPARDLRGVFCAAAVALALLALLFLDGCAKRPETASPDYANYLAAMDNIAAYEAQVDRTIWTMTTTEPVTLPAGLTMTVKAPPPALPVPQMWRDHAYEAELAYYGQIWSIVGGVAIPALSSAYQAYNTRKMVLGISKTAGGVTLNNADGGSQFVQGNWGDISSYGSGTAATDFTLQPYEVLQPAPVIVVP